MPGLPGLNVLAFLDKYIVGYALGTAAGPALRPFVLDLENQAYIASQFARLDAFSAAAVAAEQYTQFQAMADEATNTGFDGTRFQWLYDITVTAPGMGELLTLLRRGDITQTEFDHGLDKHKLEQTWKPYLEGLVVGRLSPQEVATMVQRGILPNNGILPVAPPTSGGTVPPMPMVNLDPYVEAAAGGYDAQRIEALTRIVGLPPAPGELLQMLNRGIIDTTDFARGVAEGNLRNEWGPFLEQLQRRLLSPHEYAELWLRGWISQTARDTGAALSGMTATDTALLSDMIGRPLSVHQLTTGLARGGSYGGNYQGVPSPYLEAMQQSNIRPEWGNLAYANRYTYPSAFVLRSLAQAGDLGTAAQVEQILLEIGWPPYLAALVAPQWVGGTTASDPHVAKAESQLWTTLHRSYVAEDTDDPTALATLSTLGVASGARPQVLALWKAETALIRKQLTPLQVKKAYSEGVLNPATGAAWTQQDALTALLDRGYNLADASTLLEL